MRNRQLISYVLPVYNEEEGIDKLYKVLCESLSKLSNKYNIEIIFINDGSRDNSLDKLIQLHEKDSRVKVVNFSRNFGHQIAITAGIDMALGDAVVIMDSDLQDPPEVSLELIKKWEEGYEVVYAQRKTRKDTFFKKFTAHMFYRLLEKFASIKIPKDTGDFRLMDKKAVEQMRKFRERNRFMRGLAAYIGFKQTGVQFDRNERGWGKTNYPLKKMLRLAFDAITSFSTVPLQFITQIGFWVCLLSFAGIIYALLVRIFYPGLTVHGTTLAIICTLFIGGIQMLMIGVLGTYIGRIYSEVQHRPLYIVSSVYSKGKEEREPIPENWA